MAGTVQSLFGDMFKTPEQIRREQQAALMNEGRQSAGMLMAGGGSGLAQAIKGQAANIAQYIPTSADQLKRGALQAAGQLSGMLGNEGGKRALNLAAMSPEERDASILRESLKGVDLQDPVALRNAAKRLQEQGLVGQAERLTSKADQVEVLGDSKKKQKLELDALNRQADAAEQKLKDDPILAEIMGRDLSSKEARTKALKDVAELKNPQAIKDLRGYFFQLDELSAKTAKLNDPNYTYGAQKTVRDSEGNLFFVTSKRDNKGQSTTEYDHIGGNLDKPVGKVSLVSDLGLTATEEEEKEIRTAGGTQRAKNWENEVEVAVKTVQNSREVINKVTSAEEIMGEVEVGGITAATKKKMNEVFGTTAEKPAELYYILNETVLSQLKSTFGSQFTAAEGEWLRKVSPNEGDSPAALKAKLARVKEFAQFKAEQAKGVLSSKSYDEYIKRDIFKGESEDGSWSGISETTETKKDTSAALGTAENPYDWSSDDWGN